jgi:hypothetical protein
MKTNNKYLAALTGAIMICVFAPPVSSAQKENPNFSFVMPLDFTGYNNCTDEYIHMSGAVYISDDFHADVSGGSHSTFQFRAQLNGIGQTSHLKYQINNSANQTININGNNPQSTSSFTQHWKLISQGSGDNGYLRQVFQITTNAKGEITSTVVINQDYMCGTF